MPGDGGTTKKKKILTTDGHGFTRMLVLYEQEETERRMSEASKLKTQISKGTDWDLITRGDLNAIISRAHSYTLFSRIILPPPHNRISATQALATRRNPPQ